MGHPARYIPNHPAVVDEMIDGEVVVIDLSTGSYFSLVDSAAVIWAALPAAPTADEVAGHLGQVYDAVGDRRGGVGRSVPRRVASRKASSPRSTVRTAPALPLSFLPSPPGPRSVSPASRSSTTCST